MANPHAKVQTRKEGTRFLSLGADSSVVPGAHPTLPCLSIFRVFSLSRHLAVSSLAVSHNGRHPENWLSGVPSVQKAVHSAETSEVVASFADAFTSASALTKPASSGDVTSAEGLTVYLLSGLHVMFCRHSPLGFFHGRVPAVCFVASLCCAVSVSSSLPRRSSSGPRRAP